MVIVKDIEKRKLNGVTSNNPCLSLYNYIVLTTIFKRPQSRQPEKKDKSLAACPTVQPSVFLSKI